MSDKHLSDLAFSSLNLVEPLARGVADAGFVRCTPIQAQTLPFALAEYNAGRANAQRWAAMSGPNSRKFWETITYPTTKKYIHDILKRYRGKV